MLKKLLLALGGLVALALILTLVNIAQNGWGEADGRTVDQILGKPAAHATADDLRGLGKAELMQLFLAAPAPDLAEMNGEFKAELIDAGVLWFFADWYAHHAMGPGRWLGKAFQADGPTAGHGYNLFAGQGPGQVLRAMPMDTSLAPSERDGKPAMHLVYARHNDDWNHSMHDEIRRINGGLYLGQGGLTWSGGRLNPTPFLLIGPPAPWVGVDK